MNISITGNLGSGKSSVCKILKQKGYEVISAGTIFRELAVENNMSVEDFNQKVNEDIKRGDRTVDDLIDQRTARFDATNDNIVFDSRLAWNFAPRSFKVFVMVDITEAARRVFLDKGRSDSEVYESREECRRGLIHRQELEKLRFKELYGIDYFDMCNYNLIIESTGASPEIIAEEILMRFEQYKQGRFQWMVVMNPTSIFPTRGITEAEMQLWTKQDSQGEPESQREQPPQGEQDSQGESQIQVGQAGGIWFVLKGHRKLIEAMRERRPFIEVNVRRDSEPRVLSETEYREFAACGQIEYRDLPSGEKIKEKNLLMFSYK